jgi:hypothetical protein
VVQETDHNLHPAKEFGDLFVVFTRDDLQRGHEHMIDKLSRVMTKIQPWDFILPIGDPVAIGLAITVALKKTDGKISVLKWNKQRWKYDQEDISVKL